MINSSDFSHLKIVIINKHPNLRALIRSQLYTFTDAEIFDAESSTEATELVRAIQPQIVIAPLMLSPRDGIAFTRDLRNVAHSPHPYVPIILILPALAQDRIAEARNAGVNAILLSPVSAQNLQSHVREIILHPRPFIRTSTYFGPDRRMLPRPCSLPDTSLVAQL